MIVFRDLRCSTQFNKSGYRYVNDKTGPNGRGGRKPYQAVVGTSPHFKGERTGRYVGPPRQHAWHAAADAAAILNMSTVPAAGARRRLTFAEAGKVAAQS